MCAVSFHSTRLFTDLLGRKSYEIRRGPLSRSHRLVAASRSSCVRRRRCGLRFEAEAHGRQAGLLAADLRPRARPRGARRGPGLPADVQQGPGRPRGARREHRVLQQAVVAEVLPVPDRRQHDHARDAARRAADAAPHHRGLADARRVPRAHDGAFDVYRSVGWDGRRRRALHRLLHADLRGQPDGRREVPLPALPAARPTS